MPRKRLRETRKLPPKQERFVQEYLLDLNATQAYRRAGYRSKNPDVEGPRLLGNSRVREAVDKALAARAQRVEVKQDDILREVLRVAHADLRKAFNEDGSLKPVHEWPDEVAAFIAAVDVEELFAGRSGKRKRVGYVRKVKLWPKVQALELLGKHLKLWVERHEHTGRDGGPIANKTEFSLKDLNDDELRVYRGLAATARSRRD